MLTVRWTRWPALIGQADESKRIYRLKVAASKRGSFTNWAIGMLFSAINDSEIIAKLILRDRLELPRLGQFFHATAADWSRCRR